MLFWQEKGALPHYCHAKVEVQVPPSGLVDMEVGMLNYC